MLHVLTIEQHKGLQCRMRLLLNNAHVATYDLVTRVKAETALTFMLRFTCTLYNAQSHVQGESHLLRPVGDAMRVLWLGQVPY